MNRAKIRWQKKLDDNKSPESATKNNWEQFQEQNEIEIEEIDSDVSIGNNR